MKIELYWDDVEIYAVAFSVNNMDGKIKSLERTLVFKGEMSETKVEQVIRTKFSNVIEIKFIDLVDESALELLESIS